MKKEDEKKNKERKEPNAPVLFSHCVIAWKKSLIVSWLVTHGGK